MSSSGRRSGDEPEDVLDRLANAIGVAAYDKRNRSLMELDRQLSRRGAGTNADVADDAVHVHSGVAKRCLSGLHAVEIKHLADQRVDFLRRTEDFIGTILDLALGQATVAYQLARPCIPTSAVRVSCRIIEANAATILLRRSSATRCSTAGSMFSQSVIAV